MTLQRMDNVGIAVESLDAAISFFAAVLVAAVAVAQAGEVHQSRRR